MIKSKKIDREELSVFLKSEEELIKWVKECKMAGIGIRTADMALEITKKKEKCITTS